MIKKATLYQPDFKDGRSLSEFWTGDAVSSYFVAQATKKREKNSRKKSLGMVLSTKVLCVHEDTITTELS